MIFHEPPRGRRGKASRPGRTWWLALDGPWNKETNLAHSLKNQKKALRVLGNLETFDIPPYEDIVDQVGHAGVRAGLATDNHAAWLAYLEHEATRPDDDPHKLPPQALARLRAVAAIPLQLGWPVFKG